MPRIALFLPSCVLFLCALCLCTLPARAATYTMLRIEGSEAGRAPYGVALLELAFAKAGVCHSLALSEPGMKQARAVHELAQGTGKLDIMITMSSPERETALLGVPVPLTKGLLGWRIALVRKERLHQFAEVRSAAQLQGFVAGMGHDWPDTAVLRASGLPVHLSSTYTGMFRMLEAGRIDYFPRAVKEIQAEHGRYPALAVEPHLVLRYPADAYFFVNRRNTRLAAELRKGLEAAIADGSFDRLFYSYFAPQIAAAGLERRRIIDLPNPAQAPSLPLERPELWFSLGELRRPVFVAAARGRVQPPVAAAPCSAVKQAGR